MKDVSQVWEVRNLALRRGVWGAAIFDFDGTLSLLREGWSRIMAELGLELMEGLKPPIDDLPAYLEEQMLLLSGKPSIFQMRRLAELLTEFGGTPGDPEAYLQEFLMRLFQTSEQRKSRLRDRLDPPARWAVAGTHTLLDQLQAQGVPLYLASGTDLEYVREEAELLDLTRYFGPHIYAPANNTPNFSKRQVIEQILRDHQISGSALIGFGDGYSETVEVKRVSGLAVGLATVEPGQTGIHSLKREMLVKLGADVIIPDYRDGLTLWHWLSGSI